MSHEPPNSPAEGLPAKSLPSTSTIVRPWDKPSEADSVGAFPGKANPVAPTDGLAGRLATWLATGLGIGLVVPAPGTFGSLWGLPLVYGVAAIGQPEVRLGLIAVILLVAIRIASRAARALGEAKDPQAIVIDELAVLPLVFLGFYQLGPISWKLLLAGWLFFRLFDISKPQPCKWAERLPQGWGIVADDVVAALYACLALHIYSWLDTALKWNLLT